jgi:tRNA pseudouridine55 synthase
MPALGFLNIDKPIGMTSHDVVAKIRRELKIKKVGHAGTLDPLATGVLVLCLGAATRLSEYVMDSTKQYRAQVRLGVTTDTYDTEGAILSERDASKITQSDVERTLAVFTGEIDQIPPMYSAIKQGGRKLYELARAGETVERDARRVRIDHLAVSEWLPPYFTLDVTCSAGTYIRSLAYDLGEALGVGAHLAGLIRTASGNFRIENAVALDDLLKADDWEPYVIPPGNALSDWPIANLDTDALNHIVHGRPISDSNARDGALALAYNPNNEFVAILRGDNGLWRPHKVFIEHDERA